MAQKSKPGLIDVHAHALPPFYYEILNDLDIHNLSGGTPISSLWSPQVSIEMMDEYGIDTSFFILSGWGAYSTTIARRNNEYWAKVIQDYPGRFGALAFLYLPDLKGALKELEYSMDQLKLDGIGLLTNVEGHRLTDSEHGELLAEMNRRKLVVGFQATCPPEGNPGDPSRLSNIEMGLDTLRLAGRLTRLGIFDRYPDIRFIIPFNGSGIPAHADGWKLGDEAKLAALKRQYYCIECRRNPPEEAILEFFGPSHVTWCSDFFIGNSIPDRRAETVSNIKNLRQYAGFDEKTLALVERGNALELFPRLKRG